MRSTVIGMTAGVVSIGLSAAACGSSAATSSRPAPSDSTAAGSQVAVKGGTIGAGCARIPSSGMGSVGGMATAPVVTAASHNSLLSDLVRAVRAAGLIGTLNSATAITVFAPDNAAFAGLGSGNLKALMATRSDLIKVLKYHVVNGRQTPAELASGKHLTTLGGTTIVPAKSGTEYSVNNADVVCGNIQTANATVYIVNKVLVPRP